MKKIFDIETEVFTEDSIEVFTDISNAVYAIFDKHEKDYYIRDIEYMILHATSTTAAGRRLRKAGKKWKEEKAKKGEKYD